MHSRKFALIPLAMISLLLIPGLILSVHAANGSSGPDGIVSVTLPQTIGTSADYNATCPGALVGCSGVPAGSWSVDAFSVTGTGTVTVTVTDCCYHADYYSLWKTNDPSGLTGWTLVGTTPAVETDGTLVAPGANPLWDGAGSTFSSGTFTTSVSGVTLFAVRDELFDPMLSSLASACSAPGSSLLLNGCSVTGISVSGSFSPAGLTLDFSGQVTVGESVPQFPMGTLFLLGIAAPLLMLTRSRIIRAH